MYAVPVVAAAGWVCLLVLPTLGALLMTLGSLGMVLILAVMVRREPQAHTWMMASGGLAWLVGNALWLAGVPIYQVVFWWIAFLVLTIGGERLELSRVLRTPVRLVRLFLALGVLVIAAAGLALLNLNWAARLCGVTLTAMAVWSLRYDLAVRNLRHPAVLTRYIALCLTSGFIWLGISGGNLAVLRRALHRSGV